MSKPAFDLKDSIEYSKHILYEWQMLRYNYNELNQLKNQSVIGTTYVQTSNDTESEIIISTKINEPLENAILESFLIHARNLLDFLDLEGRQDDISARKFLLSWELSNKSKETKNRINKYLAHLTVARLNKTVWNWGEVYEYVRERLTLFTKQVDTKLLCKDFIEIFQSEVNE